MHVSAQQSECRQVSKRCRLARSSSNSLHLFVETVTGWEILDVVWRAGAATGYDARSKTAPAFGLHHQSAHGGLSIALAYVVVALQYSRPDRAKVMVTYNGAWALGIAMMLYLAQDCCRSARGRCHLYHFPPTWACPWARSVHLQLAERQRPLACGAPKANIRQPAIVSQYHYVNLRPPSHQDCGV